MYPHVELQVIITGISNVTIVLTTNYRLCFHHFLLDNEEFLNEKTGIVMQENCNISLLMHNT